MRLTSSNFFLWKLFFLNSTGFSRDQRGQGWQGDRPHQHINHPDSLTSQWSVLSVARVISVDRVKLVLDCLVPEESEEIQALEWDFNNIQDFIPKTELCKSQNVMWTCVSSRERKDEPAWTEREDQRWTIIFCLVHLSSSFCQITKPEGEEHSPGLQLHSGSDLPGSESEMRHSPVLSFVSHSLTNGLS